MFEVYSAKHTQTNKQANKQTNKQTNTLRHSRLPHLVLPAARLPEVRDGGELGVDRLPIEPAVVEVLHRVLCYLLILELRGREEGVETQQRIL